MGYYLRMEEILSLQLKSQEQIERWKEELQEVGKTLEVLGDTNELQGEAGTKLKDNIKNIHMPIKTEIEALLDLFQENYSKYVLGFMELEESNTAIIKQDVLERQQKQLNLYKESYTDIYENIVDEEKGVYDKETGELNLNPNSLIEMSAYVEPELLKAKGLDSYQFVRNGFYCADIHDSKEGAPVFNRIVSLKSSFKLPKA